MYNNLIKLAADKKEKSSGHEVARALIGTVGGLKGLEVANSAAGNYLMKNRPEDLAGTQKILDSLKAHSSKVETGSDPNVQTFHVKGKSGPGKKLTYIPNMVGMPDGASFNFKDINRKAMTPTEEKIFEKAMPVGNERSHGVTVHTKNPSVLLHELGHATGSDRNDTLKHKIIGANRKLYGKSHMYAASGAGALGAGILPSIAGALTKRKAGESEEQYVDRKQRNRHLANAATAVPVLPMLAEEARASIVGHKLGKKMGVPVNKKALGAAFGTYASFLAPNAVRAATDIVANRAEKNKARNSR
jgi:hypothetical protein